MYILLVFATLTKAQRGAKILNAAGIAAGVVKSPRAASEGGCTHGVRLAESRLSAARNELGRVGLPPEKIFRVYDDGRVARL